MRLGKKRKFTDSKRKESDIEKKNEMIKIERIRNKKNESRSFICRCTFIYGCEENNEEKQKR